jgi:hypothetical protein
MVRRPLTNTQVEALKEFGTHWVAPPGLYLQIKPNGARSWLWRYKLDGKDHWHGLGAAADVGPKEADRRLKTCGPTFGAKGATRWLSGALCGP